MTAWANVSERQALQPELAVSAIVFAVNPDAPAHRRITLPLIRRIREPFLGTFAIPGGPIQPQESLDAAAQRTLRAVTGLAPEDFAPAALTQMHTFGGLRRSPGLRVVTVAYWVLLPIEAIDRAVSGGSDDPNISWHSLDDLPELAFDHLEILQAARARLAALSPAEAARSALGPKFTLTQLREVRETLRNEEIDAGNFQRSMRSSTEILPTDEFLRGTKHRPPRLYTLKTNNPTPDNPKQEKPTQPLQTSLGTTAEAERQT